MPDKRTRLLDVNDARVARARRQLTKPLERWINGLREQLTREAIADLKAGRITLRKADPITDQELLEILALFGVRQSDRAGKQIAEALGAEWIIPPGLVRDIIAKKSIEVQGIRDDIIDAVREVIREIMRESERADPRPSIATISRTMREELDGLHAVSQARAALIARTEALQNEATGIFTGMEVAGVEEQEWLSSRNPNHGKRRHDRMNGQKVKLGAMFVNPTTGNRLRYPGDPTAPISETANCFPGGVRVVYGAVEKGYRREYRGAMVTIETASGRLLTGTPNHPVLTPKGWVGLGALDKGRNVVCRTCLDVGDATRTHVDDHPLTIQQVFDFLSVGRPRKLVGADRNFHGDGMCGEVDVVFAYGKLVGRRHPALSKHALKLKLAISSLLLGPLVVFGAQRACSISIPLAASRALRSLSPALALLRAQLRETDAIGRGPPAGDNTSPNQSRADGGPGKLESFGQSEYTPPFPVELDQVSRVDVSTYSGHVFNLQTSGGLYTANGVVVHNCGCTVAPVRRSAGKKTKAA